MNGFDQIAQSEKDDDKKHQQPQEKTAVESVTELLRQPTTMVIIILVCVILGMIMQFGQIQRQMQLIQFDQRLEANKETGFENRLNRMDKDYKKLSRDEADLKFQANLLKAETRDLEQKDKEKTRKIKDIQREKQNEDDDDFPFMHRMSPPKKHHSLFDDLFDGMDDGPNELPKPHITIRPLGGPFGPIGGPFGFPGFPFGGPTGPVVHHASLADLFKNIAKPGPHPKFDGQKDSNIKIIDLTDLNKSDEEKQEDSKPVVTTPAVTAAPVPTTPAAATDLSNTDKPESVVAPTNETESPSKPIKLVNPIKKAEEMKNEIKK